MSKTIEQMIASDIPNAAEMIKAEQAAGTFTGLADFYLGERE